MSIIKLRDVSKSYGDKIILNKINLDVNPSEKIGIIGSNGSGKSTLIKIILGLEESDQGKVYLSNVTTGYLKQATEYKTKDFEEILTKENTKEFLKIVSELKINKDIDITSNNLSGGEKTKLALSSILVNSPSLLLLDEPTNHMDIEGINWLINKINTFKGTILIVSHDRYLLNKTVNKIIELDKGNLNIYYGNYDDYLYQKQKELKNKQEKYYLQQKQEKKIKKEIIKLNNWSEKGEREAGRQGGSMSDAKIKGVKTNAQRKAMKMAKSAKNKKIRLEQMQNNYIEKPYEEKDIKFFFKGFKSSSTILINIKDLSKVYGNRILFSKVNLSIRQNDKIGLIGPNGSGKTTLLKIIMNQIKQTEGFIEKATSLKYTYMSQDVFDLDEEKTIYDLAKNYNKEKREFFFSNLVNMNFDRALFKNKIKTLSLGQRMKIKLVEIILDEYNLLILDEPTNHLDLENKKELEKALINFPGSILLVSHDQYLLSKVTNKLFIFKNETIEKYEYGYSEFMKNN